MSKSSTGQDGRASAEDPDTRIAADPFIVVLPAISALAAVTSIAAVHWAAQDKTPDRARAKRKASSALRDLENCCLGLQEIFKRFRRHRRLFGGDGSSSASAPMKFGVHGPRISPDEGRQFQQLMNDTASMLVLASQNAYDVMAAVEDGELEPPEEIFFAFGEAQDRLNQLVQSRATLGVTVDVGAEVAEQLTALVRRIKAHKSDS